MRWTLLLLATLGGCSSLLGIEEWSPGDPAASSTGPVGSGGVGGAGGEAAAGGMGGAPTTTGAAGSGGAGGAGGKSCSAPIACYHSPPNAVKGMAECNLGAPSGPCVPVDWDYCSCDTNTPAAFVEYGTRGQLVAVTLLASTSDEPYSLGVGSAFCAYGPQENCVSSCPNGYGLYRWTDFQGHESDSNELHFWRNDTAAPCDPGPGSNEGVSFFALDPL